MGSVSIEGKCPKCETENFVESFHKSNYKNSKYGTLDNEKDYFEFVSNNLPIENNRLELKEVVNSRFFANTIQKEVFHPP